MTSFKLHDLDVYKVKPQDPISFSCDLAVTLTASTEMAAKSGSETQFSLSYVISDDNIYDAEMDVTFAAPLEPAQTALLQVSSERAILS